MPTVAEIVTERLLDILERDGIQAWQKRWAFSAANGKTKRPYRGTNALLLASLPYDAPYYVTAKQAKELGGSIRPEEWNRGHLVVFVKTGERQVENEEGELETKRSYLLRYYKVWNVGQCDWPANMAGRWAAPAPRGDAEAVDVDLWSGFPAPQPGLESGEPAYSPSTDTVIMPPAGRFASPADHAQTLAHELAHATGHERRLNRPIRNKFGSPDYAKEELIAELTSAMVLAQHGLTYDWHNAAAYLSCWLRAMRADARYILSVASAAQKAADHILGTAAAANAAA